MDRDRPGLVALTFTAKHWALSDGTDQRWRWHNVRTWLLVPILYNARRRHKAEERFNARYCWMLCYKGQVRLPDHALTVLDASSVWRAEQFAVKSSAIFINAGRGPVVSENALNATCRKEIHAARLDVFRTRAHCRRFAVALNGLSSQLPHIGSATHERVMAPPVPWII